MLNTHQGSSKTILSGRIAPSWFLALSSLFLNYCYFCSRSFGDNDKMIKFHHLKCDKRFNDIKSLLL